MHIRYSFVGLLSFLAILSTGVGQPTQAYSHGNPTAAEQYMLELVNRARMNPAGEAALSGIDLNEGLASNTISALPKQPLTFNPSLLQSSRQHSQWMLDEDTFSHTGADGSSPADRMKAAGYVFSGSWSYAENLGWRGSTGVPPVNSMVAQIHKDLFVDADVTGRGHRLNLLADGLREIGVGVKTGLFTYNLQTYNGVMVTQDFGRTDADPAAFLVGVVFQDLNGNGSYDPGEGLPGINVVPSSGVYYALTSDSGGYAIPLSASSGTLVVSISGGSLAAPITKTAVLTGRNVKLDFNTAIDRPTASPIVLRSPQRLSNGQFSFGLLGRNGQTVIIQSSEDLIHWTNRQTLNLTVGASFVDPTSPSFSRRFYRVLQQ